MKKFDFWKDNRKDQHYQLTREEFLAKIKEWLFTKEVAWLEHYGTHGTVLEFVTSKDGLSSINEGKQMNQLIQLAAEGGLIWNHVDKIKALKPLLQARVNESPEKLSLWGVIIKDTLDAGKDISSVVRSILEGYTDVERNNDDPTMLERMFGKEVVEILWQLSLKHYEPRGKNLGGYDLKKLL